MGKVIQFAGGGLIIAEDALLIEELYGKAEGDGASHDDGVSDHGGEDAGVGGNFLLVTELVDAELHAHFWDLDIGSGFDGVEEDAADTGGRAHTGFAEAGGAFMELDQFAGEEGEADEAEGIGIGGDDDLIGAKEGTLGGTQDIGGAIEEYDIVVGFDGLELMPEAKEGRLVVGRGEFVFEIDEVEGSGEEVEAGEDRGTIALGNDIALADLAEGSPAWLKDGVEGTGAGGLEVSPAFDAHEPDTGVGLCVQVDQEDPLTGFGDKSADIDEAAGFADASLVVNECYFACHELLMERIFGEELVE